MKIYFYASEYSLFLDRNTKFAHFWLGTQYVLLVLGMSFLTIQNEQFSEEKGFILSDSITYTEKEV